MLLLITPPLLIFRRHFHYAAAIFACFHLIFSLDRELRRQIAFDDAFAIS